ncbi:hydrogen peroxide-inducible genes activator [Ensifer sp.]|jgi:LysR family hydrogen peroxide-inducible transcriptional activator|uniref:hydrogen peroxide-inducible genes activator n=1 Tax=Ensifer sp. TaxID=1872086 RepID=UPI002E10CA0A|nr:hydrogen peroxide-inducible genes activator [Ensifer sp.]
MTYRPTLRQLEYIAALDDLRHFGKAARRCHVSQPTLSVQIGLVEKSLGVTLFERTPTSVIATPAGHDVARSARMALATVDELVASALKDTQSLGGLVRMATAPTFGPYFLPGFLPGIHRKFPDLKIYIREDRPARIEMEVSDGAVDCGLGPAPERPGLRFRRLGHERIFLGVPADHHLASQATVKASALRGERLLALGSGHRLLENVRQLAAVADARVIDDYEGTSLDSIRQMVSIGMGCSLFPELYARAEFRRDDDVRLIEIEDWTARREVGFYWRENSGRERHYEILAREADAVARDKGIA